jgi:hypothetical protein
MVVQAYNPNYEVGYKQGNHSLTLALGKAIRPHLKKKKNYTQKGLGDVAQMAECKHVALSSNPSTTSQKSLHFQIWTLYSYTKFK